MADNKNDVQCLALGKQTHMSEMAMRSTNQ
jgi:hypothetical protein